MAENTSNTKVCACATIANNIAGLDESMTLWGKDGHEHHPNCPLYIECRRCKNGMTQRLCDRCMPIVALEEDNAKLRQELANVRRERARSVLHRVAHHVRRHCLGCGAWTGIRISGHHKCLACGIEHVEDDTLAQDIIALDIEAPA